MTNTLIIILFLILILIFFSFTFFYLKQRKSSVKKTKIIPSSFPFFKEQENNPDLSTDNWDLHKFRLEKFKRSQYKGLTFFLSSENRIYYLSQEGKKVYC